jgi:DNA-binding response OmpR family regulator
MSNRILLVEDDAHIGEMLQQALTREGYEVEWVAEGEPAIRSAVLATPDLILLDLKLPDVDGLQVCRRLRAQSDVLPIIILTARSEEIDVVIGLDAGADDYVVKPFRLAELLARVRAHLRRPVRPSESEVMEVGNVEVNLAARRALVAERGEMALRPKEFDLLSFLMLHHGRALTRTRITEEVWGSKSDSTTKTLDVHIGTLRRKMLDGGASARIVTIRGTGYRLDPAESSDGRSASSGQDHS